MKRLKKLFSLLKNCKNNADFKLFERLYFIWLVVMAGHVARWEKHDFQNH